MKATGGDEVLFKIMICAFALLLLAGCGDDRCICPEPPEPDPGLGPVRQYYVYIHDENPGEKVFVYSTREGRMIDSLCFADEVNAGALAVTKDGNRLFVGVDDDLYVFNTATLEVDTILQDWRVGKLEVDPGGKYLIGNFYGLRVADVETYEILFQHDHTFSYIAFDSTRHLAYFQHVMGGAYSVFDYEAFQFYPDIVIPVGWAHSALTIVPETQKLYCLMGAPPIGLAWIVGYDLQRREVIFQHAVTAATGDVATTVNQKYVIVVNGGQMRGAVPPTPYIYYIDTETDSIVTEIWTVVDSTYARDFEHIVLTDDGHSAFAADVTGPVVEINVPGREITREIWLRPMISDHYSTYPGTIKIGNEPSP